MMGDQEVLRSKGIACVMTPVWENRVPVDLQEGARAGAGPHGALKAINSRLLSGSH